MSKRRKKSLFEKYDVITRNYTKLIEKINKSKKAYSTKLNDLRKLYKEVSNKPRISKKVNIAKSEFNKLERIRKNMNVEKPNIEYINIKGDSKNAGLIQIKTNIPNKHKNKDDGGYYVSIPVSDEEIKQFDWNPEKSVWADIARNKLVNNVMTNKERYGYAQDYDFTSHDVYIYDVDVTINTNRCNHII